MSLPMRTLKSGTARKIIGPPKRTARDTTKEVRNRGIAAVNDVVDVLANTPSLDLVLDAQNDLEVLVTLLSTPQVLDLLAPDEPVLRAKLRGLQKRKELLEAEGGCISSQEVADMFQISRMAVHKRITQGKKDALLGIQTAKHGFFIPIWQFSENGMLDGVSDVLQALRENHIDPWGQLIFFLTEDARLKGQRPLDLLKAGEKQLVLEAACSYGEQSA